MRLIDMHCDTVMKMIEFPQKEWSEIPTEITLKGLHQSNSMAQFFACFTNKEDYPQPTTAAYDWAYQTVLKMIDRIKREIQNNPKELALALNADEILKNDTDGKISVFLTVEEGGVLNGQMQRLYDLYKEGIRLITLTWNYENCLGFPNSSDPKEMRRGLTPFGLETIGEMNRLGIMIDVSHLSDGGFWDVVEYSKKPFVATHSCVRDLCGHTRNLTKEMIRAVGEKGGAIGVNFYGGFLSESGKSSAKEIARHLRFIADTAGVESAAIGTDFDGGISANPLEISDISKMDLLYRELKSEGFHEEEIEKIFWKNVLRVIRETVR